MKKFLLFLNLFFPVSFNSFSSHSSISSKSSFSSFKTAIIQQAKNECIMQNITYANAPVNYEYDFPKTSGPSSKKKFCIVMFGLLIAGLLVYDYTNNQTSYSNSIVI